MFGEPFICDTAGLLEAGDAFTDFHVYPAIGVGEVEKVILGDDSVGEHMKVHLHVFVPGHWRAVVKILYVHACKACSRGGDGTVEEKLGSS